MYEVLDKDTTKFEILPHLSGAKHGYVTKSDLAEAIRCILYKLKTVVSDTSRGKSKEHFFMFLMFLCQKWTCLCQHTRKERLQ